MLCQSKSCQLLHQLCEKSHFKGFVISEWPWEMLKIIRKTIHHFLSAVCTNNAAIFCTSFEILRLWLPWPWEILKFQKDSWKYMPRMFSDSCVNISQLIRATFSEVWESGFKQLKWLSVSRSRKIIGFGVIWLATYDFLLVFHCHYVSMPSVLWKCWLDIRNSIRPVKNWVMTCYHGYLSAVRCKWLAYAPADATATPSSLALLKFRMV